MELSDIFDIDITNEDSVQLERTRLEILLKNKGSVKDPLLQARLTLDEARLSFYALSQSDRLDLLDRFKAHKEAQTTQTLASRDQAQQQAAEAELLAQKALEDAQKARTEADRLVSEERARLMEITAAQADFELTLVQDQELLQQRLERILALKRKTSEITAEQNSAVADAFYDDIRKTLKTARSDFANAMSASVAPSRIPKMPPSQLTQLAIDVDQSELRNIRRDIDANTLRLGSVEEEIRQRKANQLYDEIHLLNTLRLNLIPDLSDEKRSAVTGLGLVAFEQAVAEFNHIMLELRFRLLTTQEWLRGEIITNTKATSLFAVSFFILKWLFAVAIFIWWRRKGDSVLDSIIVQLQQQDRLNRNTTPQPMVRILRFFLKIRGVLEWLVLIWWLEWIIPGTSIEIDLVTTALSWMLGGALGVNIINALSAERDVVRLYGVALKTSDLRLRSLRLVGRMVVVLGLSLALSSRLVGHGTIYNWVVKICWLSVVPILFTIIHWWKPAIFMRIRSIRKKKSFENWIVEHERGWSSFPSAVAAGTYLFLRGSVRVVRQQVDQFELTRRALAYFFRRGLDRLASEDLHTPLAPLPLELFNSLGPDVRSEEVLQKPFGSDLKDFLVDSKGQRIAGVFALVAERGAGKSTIIKHVATQH